MLTIDWRYGLFRQRKDSLACLNRSNEDPCTWDHNFLSLGRNYFTNTLPDDRFFVIDFQTGDVLKRFRLQPPTQRFEMVEL